MLALLLTFVFNAASLRLSYPPIDTSGGISGQASDKVVELFQSGARHEAIALLEEDVRKAPDNAALRLQLVQCLMSMRMYRRSLELIRPKVGEALRGRALFFLARYEEALDHLDVADEDEVLMVVDALEALGRLEERDRAIERARKVLGPNHASVQVLLGRRAASKGAHAEAVGFFRKAVDLDPVEPEALFGLGSSLVRSGKREEGRVVLEEHRRVLPLLDQLEFAERSLQLNPGHAPNQAALAGVHRALGQLDRAESCYRSALSGASDEQLVPIVLRYARFHVENRADLDKAVALLGEAAQRVRDVRLHLRAGDLLAAAGRQHEARAAFERALQVRPGDSAIVERLRKLEDAR